MEGGGKGGRGGLTEIENMLILQNLPEYIVPLPLSLTHSSYC